MPRKDGGQAENIGVEQVFERIKFEGGLYSEFSLQSVMLIESTCEVCGEKKRDVYSFESLPSICDDCLREAIREFEG